MCRTAYNNYVLTLAENGHITKILWSYIKSQRKDNSGIPPLSQNRSSHTVTKNLHHQPWKTIISDIAPITIDIHGVKSLLDNLDSHKPAGLDNIPTQQLGQEFSPALTMIFQVSQQIGKQQTSSLFIKKATV